MFAWNFSNIDFCLEILPLKDDDLVMSEMQKQNGGVTEFVLEKTCPEEHPKSVKSGFFFMQYCNYTFEVKCSLPNFVSVDPSSELS